MQVMDAQLGRPMRIVSVALIMISASLLGCEGTTNGSSPALHGRVVDAVGAPIPDALVYSRWDAVAVPTGFTAHNSPRICYRFATAVSNADGTFTIPALKLKLDFRVTEPTRFVAAYKVGYEWLRTDNEAIYMSALPEGAERQVTEIRKNMQFCLEADARHNDKFELFKRLYCDARAMPSTESQQQLVEMLRERAMLDPADCEPNAPPDTHEKGTDE